MGIDRKMILLNGNHHLLGIEVINITNYSSQINVSPVRNQSGKGVMQSLGNVFDIFQRSLDGPLQHQVVHLVDVIAVVDNTRAGAVVSVTDAARVVLASFAIASTAS